MRLLKRGAWLGVWLGVGFFSGLIPGSLPAQVSEWQSNEHGRVRLVAPYIAAPQSGEITFGVHFQPAPGWMLYWKQPGDAGYAPKFNFKGSRGFQDPEVLWPRPKYFILPGEIKEYGYDGEVIYPVKARAVAGQTLHIHLDLDYLTCKESCVPYRYTLTLDIPQAAAVQPDPSPASAIQQFVNQVPPAGEDVLASLRPEIAGPEEKLGWILLLGLLGGLILNVMPCVLPVLSIKLFGLLQHGGRDRRVIVRDSLASAAGIIFSFLAGAGLLVLAQTAGKAVGWGIQFQNPGFVAFLFVLVVLFALNLWGVFEINLPPALTRVGSIGQDDEGPLSYFFSGMFATLLATPCSAPFLGTAIGFALSQSAAVTLAIFGAAGLGMALPYIALALFPGALQWLPRPGIWMSKVKIFLGFLLAATAVWLGWVFVQQVRPVEPVKSVTASKSLINWVPFDESKIKSLVAGGTPVFVDVTADWCVTCKVNERFVIQNAEVAAEFKKRGVVMMRADWTHQDTAIGDYLKRHGRAGIPFYALYYPYKGPVVLSELLTKKQVLNVLRTIGPQ